MHLQNLLFYITLAIFLQSSIQNEISYEISNISVDKGSDVVLTCTSLNGNATWMNIHNHSVSINKTGVSELSIKNVHLNHTYNCQKSDNIVQQFVVTVHARQARILFQSSDIVKNGTNILLSCVVRSILPADTAYLRADDIHTSKKYIAHWESRKRICRSNDYNRSDCVMDTTFQYDIEVLENNTYSCGYEDAESESIFVEVISKPIIYEATRACASQDVQEKIIRFAIEALEKYGLTHNTATYIRQKCDSEFGLNPWNCIIGRRQATEFSLSPNIFDEPYSSIRFSLGSIYFSIFRTNK